jgi:HEAT repeat protein
VFEEASRASESLPWVCYKDGVRTIEFLRGFEGDELDRFLAAIQTVRSQTSDDDLVTLFWECDFTHLAYKYVEAGGDGTDAPGAELLRSAAPQGAVETPPDHQQDAGSYGASSSPFARIEDFDSTLYFLEEQEIAYLQQSLAHDFGSDLRPSVIAALLDTFELEDDPTVREEICGILDNFLLVLLANQQFRAAAYLLRECDAAAERARGLLASHRERLSQLAGRLSEPTVLAQLLESLEDTLLRPPQSDLLTLFGQLRAPALPALVGQMVRSRNGELRALLESAVTRIAGANTSELVALIESPDEAVAAEAARRAGALRSPAAVAPLARLLEMPSLEGRRAAVDALAQIATAGAMQGIERALEDADRGIRLAAVQVCVERQHRGALSRVERAVKEWVMKDGSTQEKTAFFDAYAVLGGDAAVPFLEGVLNPRGFLARKEEPSTRACAAMALGRIGSPRALEALQKAAGDKDVVVRSAASRALRGSA